MSYPTAADINTYVSNQQTAQAAYIAASWDELADDQWINRINPELQSLDGWVAGPVANTWIKTFAMNAQVIGTAEQANYITRITNYFNAAATGMTLTMADTTFVFTAD